MKGRPERSRSRRMWAASWITGAVLLGGVPGCGQSTTPPPAPKALATTTLYHLFFRHINFLGQRAADAEKSGQKGAPLRKYYQGKIGLTDAAHSALLARAATCEKDVAAQDAATRKLIDQFHHQNPKGSDPITPAQSAQAVQMQSQRDAILQNHISLLKADVGDAAFQSVDSFVKGTFARGASVQALPTGQAALLTAKRAKAIRSERQK